MGALGTAHARSLWSRVDGELAEVRIGWTQRAWVLERDVETLRVRRPRVGSASSRRVICCCSGANREGLVADETVRRELWKAIGSVGLVLSDGRPVALWRARKQGRRLAVELDAFAPMALDDVQAEADRLAPHHACASARVEVA